MSKEEYRGPSVAVDLVIRHFTFDPFVESVVLIERHNPPYGYALPGGFVDYGEATYDAAIREAKEETGLSIELQRQLHTYSHPQRDPRQHVISVAYVATSFRPGQKPIAADDAKSTILVKNCDLENWLEENKEKLAFDHYHILKDYLKFASGCIPNMLHPEVERERFI